MQDFLALTLQGEQPATHEGKQANFSWRWLGEDFLNVHHMRSTTKLSYCQPEYMEMKRHQLNCYLIFAPIYLLGV